MSSQEQASSYQADHFQEFLTPEQRQALVAQILGEIALRILNEKD